MEKRNALVVVLMFLTSFVFGQSQFSSEPGAFSAEILKMMKDSKSENLIKIGEEFDAIFLSFSADEQKKIITLSQELKKKKQAASVFGYYFGAIIAAKNSGDVSTQTFGQFLEVSKTVYDKEGAANFNNFVKTSAVFFAKKALYQSSFNSYLVDGGTFSFEYIEGAKEETILDKYDQNKGDEKEKEADPFDQWDSGTDNSENNNNVDFNADLWGDEPVIDKTKNDDAKNDEEENLEYGYQAPEQPKPTGAVIKIQNANIIIQTKYDSTMIENTSGSLMVLKNFFIGEGGKFNWSPAGQDMADIYVELGQYNFKTTDVRISAEKTKLYYPAATSKAVEGIFEFKSEKKSSSYEPKYPRFMSYKSGIDIKNIGDNIEYKGGLSLEGRRQNSSSLDGSSSSVIVSVGGKEKFRAMSSRFDISDSVLSSNAVNVIVKAGNDSILHPNMYLKYYQGSQILKVFRGPKSRDVSPFFDTHHNVEIHAEKLEWDMNTEDIHFSMIYAKNQKSAKVESKDFYTHERYSEIMGLSKFHPLQMAANFAKQKKTNTIYVADLAKDSKQNIDVIRSGMSKMNREGYVSYNAKTGKVTILRKGWLYVEARRDKVDYDNLIIFSKTNSNNITLDLKNNNLVIKGVKDIMLSPPQNVRVVPDSNKVIMKGNRDIYFNGIVYAGNFVFAGTNYRFDYDSFFVNMANIDSIRLKFETEEKDVNENPTVHTLGNKLVYSSGYLYIDKQNNKSHKKNYPEYPIFDATSGAYVYFDDEKILNKAYDRTVYFRIPPFTVDSLNEAGSQTYSFNGTFYPGEIMPPFEEVLRIMPDYTFGFNHTTPSKGYDLYGGKGKYTNKIQLDGKGIRGDGTITYLNTTAQSNDFIFYLDSVSTKGTTLDIKEGKHKTNVTYPLTKVTDYTMNWKAKQDSMIVSNTKELITFYNGKASLDGKINITPSGTYGAGTVKSGNADVISPKLFFAQTEFKANSADFKVNTDNPGKPAIIADSVHLEFNVQKEIADFGPEEEGRASIEFPYMQYKTSISHGTWNKKENTVVMKKDKDEAIETSFFYSINPDHAGLSFNAEEAVCDLTNFIINIYGVPFIKVADSKIIPDSNHVFIRENADMKTLKNATVIIDTISQYHTLDSGEINIISRHAFEGKALYQFVNAAQDTFRLEFSNFTTQKYSDKKKETQVYSLADGYVAEMDSFFIAPRIQYYGNMQADARENFLYFDGFVKINLKNAFLSDWFKFTGRIDPNNVVVDLKDPKAADGTPLVTGLHISKDSSQIYTSFIAIKDNPADLDIMTASGKLGYDPSKNEFRISNPLKEEGKSYAGNMLVINDSTANIKYEGGFNFVAGVPKVFEIKSGGTGFGNIKSEEYNFDVLMSILVKLPAFITKEMGDSIYESTRGNYEAILSKSDIIQKVAEVAGNTPAENYNMSSLAYIPLYDISSSFNRTFVFTNVKLKSSQKDMALYSNDTLGLSNIMRKDINAMVNGFLEIKRDLEGKEELNIYLQPDSLLWYYINFKDNTAYMLSSSMSLNAGIFYKSNIANRTNPAQFAFGLADYVMKESFIYHYKKDYMNQKVDTLNPIFLNQLQSDLLQKIEEMMGGTAQPKGKSKQKTQQEEELYEDIFFEDNNNQNLEDNQNDDLNNLEENNGEENQNQNTNKKEKKKKPVNTDENQDLNENNSDSDEMDLDLGEENQQENNTKQKKIKEPKPKKVKPTEENNDSLLDGLDEDL